jgi:UDP-2-acetamido-3-amino-2,3-dideoxy-glucuronate N-acetyltransferase
MSAIVQSKIPGSAKVLEYSVVREGCEIGEDVVIGPHAVIGPSCSIGKGSRILPFAHLEGEVKIGSFSLVGPHANLRPGTKIGDYSVFGTLSQSEGKNKIGSHVTIHTNCHITKGVEIEDWVFIAPFFVGANTPRIVHGRDYPMEVKAYRVKYGARIGIDVSVMPGITIGREALIGAGSLVTKDVPDFAIAFGRPAQVHGEVPESERLHK